MRVSCLFFALGSTWAFDEDLGGLAIHPAIKKRHRLLQLGEETENCPTRLTRCEASAPTDTLEAISSQWMAALDTLALATNDTQVDEFRFVLETSSKVNFTGMAETSVALMDGKVDELLDVVNELLVTAETMDISVADVLPRMMSVLPSADEVEAAGFFNFLNVLLIIWGVIGLVILAPVALALILGIGIALLIFGIFLLPITYRILFGKDGIFGATEEPNPELRVAGFSCMDELMECEFKQVFASIVPGMFSTVVVSSLFSP